MYTLAENKIHMENNNEKSWKVLSAEKTEELPTDVANGSIALLTDKDGVEALTISVFCEETGTWGGL